MVNGWVGWVGFGGLLVVYGYGRVIVEYHVLFPITSLLCAQSSCNLIPEIAALMPTSFCPAMKGQVV